MEIMVDKKSLKQFARNRLRAITNSRIERQKKTVYGKLNRYSGMKLTEKNRNRFFKVLSEICDYIQNYQDFQLLETSLELELYERRREELFKSRRKELSRILKLKNEMKIRLGTKNDEAINEEIQQRVNDFASEYDSAGSLLNSLGEVISRSKGTYQSELEFLGETVSTTIGSFKKPLLTKKSEFEVTKKFLYSRVENKIESSTQNFQKKITIISQI